MTTIIRIAICPEDAESVASDLRRLADQLDQLAEKVELDDNPDAYAYTDAVQLESDLTVKFRIGRIS